MRNGWGGWLSNVGGAYLFFLHSLMGNFFFFCRGHGPPKPLCGSAPGRARIRSEVISGMDEVKPSLVLFLQ